MQISLDGLALAIAFVCADFSFFWQTRPVSGTARLSCDPDLLDGAVVAHHDGRKDRLPQGLGAGGGLRDGGGGGEGDHDEVGLHPGGCIADLVFGMQISFALGGLLIGAAIWLTVMPLASIRTTSRSLPDNCGTAC